MLVFSRILGNLKKIVIRNWHFVQKIIFLLKTKYMYSKIKKINNIGYKEPQQSKQTETIACGAQRKDFFDLWKKCINRPNYKARETYLIQKKGKKVKQIH